VTDGDQVMIIISVQDVSRLAIDGGGRLKTVWSPDGYLELESDKEQGEAFFKATSTAPKTFSFFARDDFGNTYTIIATQDNVPSQTIILVPKNNERAVTPDMNKQALPYKNTINTLFKGMFLNKDINGYLVAYEDIAVPVWAETSITLVRTYQGNRYKGEVYRIVNISEAELIFHESEFFEFGEGVLAVGLEHLAVPTGQTTQLYVVRSLNEGN
jgi:type-F conjugative transfer system secretin TraK